MKPQDIEKIYLKCPTWFQNILVSLYGYQEHRRRYSKEFEKLLPNLEKNSLKQRLELDLLIENRLLNIINAALSQVPYYQKLKIKEKKLSSFPLLSRQAVAENLDSLLNQDFIENKLISLYTAGSSGSPLHVKMTKKIRQQTYAFWALFYLKMGFKIGEKKASFVGRKIQSPDKNKPPFWRYNAYDKQLLFSSYHMTEENLFYYVKKLNDFKPKIIEGYPLSIYRLAEFIIKNSCKLEFQLSGISTSSEHFSLEHRSAMEKAFNCKVYDQYGSAESVVFAAECQYGKMHVEPEYGIIEILKENGDIDREGAGELVATTLLNDVMPLIRYRIGDLGEINYRDCLCGRQTAILTNLYGKVGAVIVSNDKKISTAAIALAFKYAEGIKNSQVTQDQAESILVKLVKNTNYKKTSEDAIVRDLRRMLGEGMIIRIEYVAEIPVGKNGKYELVKQLFYKKPN
jgi:phenylacetate-CoA ligase